MAKRNPSRASGRYIQSFAGDEGQPVDLRLQLTKQRQFLNIDAGEVSDMAGIDVIRPWRRADPTVPLDVSIDGSLQPITQAFGSVFEGNGTQVFVGVAGSSAAESMFVLVAASGDVPAYIKIGTQSYTSMFGGNGWPVYLNDGNTVALSFVVDVIQTDTAGGAKEKRGEPFRVLGVKTRDNPNDTLEIDQDLASNTAFVITASRRRNLRGIIVTDGREFRLLQGGAYESESLLVVDEAAKGDTWRVARISNSRMLLVSDRNVPRVITLEGDQPPQLIAGQIALSYVVATGVLSHVSEDFMFSMHVQAVEEGWLLARVQDATAKDFVSPLLTYNPVVGTSVNLEIPSSGIADATASATAQFEHRGRGMARYAGPPPIIPSVGEDAGPSEAMYMDQNDPPSASLPSADKGDHSVLVRLLDLETNAVSPFLAAGAGLSIALGGREAVLDGNVNARRINLKFNRSALLFPHRSQIVQIYRKLAAGSDYFLEKEVPVVCFGDQGFNNETVSGDTTPHFRIVLTMPDDVLRLQPLLELNDRIHGVPPAGKDVAVLTDVGVTLIAGKTDLDFFNDPKWGDGRFKYRWPRVNDDNTVHFSRTDVSEPENFPPSIRNQITLSQLGDKFQKFAQAGDDVLAVMSEGVYRLSAGGPLGVRRHVLGETGIGTPWPDSVITVRRKAMWVSSSNVFLYDRSAEGTERPPLTTIGNDLYSWIRSAVKDGDTIKCAYDSRRQVAIIRRIKVNGLYQDVEMAVSGNSITFMEDRIAADFMPSPFAGITDEDHSILYAVGDQGDAREIGRELEVGDTHPYDGKEDQIVLDGTHTIDDTSVSKVAAFTTAMIGDTVRFKSTTGTVNGQVRKIESINHTAFSETLDNNSILARIAMLNSRLGFVGYIDLDTNDLVIRQISIADDGVITVSGGAHFDGTNFKSDLSLEPWGEGLVFTAINATDEPVAGAILFRDGALLSVTPSNFVSLDPGDVRVLVDSAQMDGSNVVQVWKSDAAASHAIDITAITVAATGEIKAPEAANITQVASGNADTIPTVVRLTDTIAISSYNSGSDLVASVITFDGELITEIDTSILQATSSTVNTIVALTPTEFVAIYGQGSTLDARLGTVDTDLDSDTYGDITLGASINILGNASANVKATRMSDTSLVVILSATTLTDVLAIPVQVNPDKTLGSGAAVTLGSNDTNSNAIASLGDNHWLACYVETALSDVFLKSGAMFGGKETIPPLDASLKLQLANLTYGPPDKITFDAVPGLAAGDEIIIGSVPFRIKFAPITGSRARMAKALNGISAWVQPDGRTVTTAKTVKMQAFRNLGDTAAQLNRAAAVEATVPIKAPSEVTATDDARFADIHVEGKMIELEISNDDADTGLSIVHLSGAVRESGDPLEDRSTTG